MEGWESGPMMQDPELEEGEACYHKEDTSIDPDVALSYLDDKVQSILGHFQKDFEGGVSAENLGAKFGGYGSFLPTYQRSPSVLAQPKSPLRAQKPGTPKSPYCRPSEGIPHHSGVLPNEAFSHRNVANVPPAVHPLQNVKAQSGDGLSRQDGLLSDQVADSCPTKPGVPSSKSDNQTDQRKLKVRIKVGYDRTTQRNAAIYSGLGLISPSSSVGNSAEESGGISREAHEFPDESPSRILKLMTSFPVCGILLSPLHEDLLNPRRERKWSVDIDPAPVPKDAHNYTVVRVDDANPRLENGNVIRGKKSKSVDKRANSVKSKNESSTDLKEEIKSSGSETLECRLQSSNDLNCKPISDAACNASDSLKGAFRATEAIREVEREDPMRKREGDMDGVHGRVGSADMVKEDSLESISGQSGGKYDYREPKNRSAEKSGIHRVRNSQKDGSVDHGNGSRCRGKKILSSIKGNCDISEGEMVSRRPMDPSSQKYVLKSTSGEQDDFRMSPAVNKLSLQGRKKSKGNKSSVKLDSNLPESSLRSGVSSANKDKLTAKKDSHKQSLTFPKQSLERAPDDGSKNSNPDVVKEKHTFEDKHKKNATGKKLNNQVNTCVNLKDTPADALPSAEGLISETEQAPAPSVVIRESWVCCDRCQKWRLLPIDTVAEHLPEKWVCSMLNWLPGLNRCDVSEDETTKALYALYQVPFPDNQSNLQTNADNIPNGASSGGDNCLNQNHQNYDSDRTTDGGKKKQKYEVTQNTDINRDPMPSNLNKNFRPQPMRNRSLKEVKWPQAAPDLINKSNLHCPNKSPAATAKTLNKRNDEHLVGDKANPTKKIKRESDQHVPANLKKVKSEGAVNFDDFQSSGRVGQSPSSGLPNKITMLKDKKKQRVLDSRSDGGKNLQNSGRRLRNNVQELDNRSLDMNACNTREISTKKRKLKDSAPETNGSDLPNNTVSVKEESSNGGFHREKKSRVSKIDRKGLTKGEDDNIPNKILISGNKENPFDRSLEKEQQVRKYRAKLPVQLTMDDIESLRKDLGSEPLSMAATSSSSKISDSRKTRRNCKQVKGSPEESVSSSPMRMSHLNKALPVKMETVEKVDSRRNDFPTMGSPRKSLDGNGKFESNHFGTARKVKATNKLRESSEPPVLDFRDSDARNKYSVKSESGTDHPSEYGNGSFAGDDGDILEIHSICPTSSHVSEHNHGKERMNKNHSSEHNHGKERMNTNHSNIASPQQIFKKTTPSLPMDKIRTSGGNFERVAGMGQEVLDINKPKGEQETLPPNEFVPGALKGNFTDSRGPGNSVVGDFSKASEEPVNTHRQHGTNNFNGHNVVDGTKLGAVSQANKNSSSLTPISVLKEAENLRDYADRLKDSGFPFESNEAYFEAALKFLQGASLLEACNGETSKHGEVNQIQMYSSTAKLFDTCARGYEKRQEMAAAALAYKCMEVAYMRVVYCKNSSACRLLHDLQSSLPSGLQGESPSSSASDIDNLNNLMVDKAVSSKGNGSQVGNNVMVPRNHPNLVRLLDFTKDVNSAMEASRKSQNCFAAADVNPKDAQDKEDIVYVKMVMDFSFQNVEELVHLVRLAFKAVNRQGFSGNRE